MFYLAACVEFPAAVVVVVGVVAEALVEPSASVDPACWTPSSLGAGSSMKGVAPVPPVTRGKTPSHLWVLSHSR